VFDEYFLFAMAGFSDSSLAKYARGIKALPSEIFNWHLFITVIGFALTGTPKGMWKLGLLVLEPASNFCFY
jgi:hypothetical protein